MLSEDLILLQEISRLSLFEIKGHCLKSACSITDFQERMENTCSMLRACSCSQAMKYEGEKRYIHPIQ